MCMRCGEVQKSSNACASAKCAGAPPFAKYYCDQCKVWEDFDTGVASLFHCPRCSACVEGVEEGRDVLHCDNCKRCHKLRDFLGHKCLTTQSEDSLDSFVVKALQATEMDRLAVEAAFSHSPQGPAVVADIGAEKDSAYVRDILCSSGSTNPDDAVVETVLSASSACLDDTQLLADIPPERLPWLAERAWASSRVKASYAAGQYAASLLRAVASWQSLQLDQSCAIDAAIMSLIRASGHKAVAVAREASEALADHFEHEKPAYFASAVAATPLRVAFRCGLASFAAELLSDDATKATAVEAQVELLESAARSAPSAQAAKMIKLLVDIGGRVDGCDALRVAVSQRKPEAVAAIVAVHSDRAEQSRLAEECLADGEWEVAAPLCDALLVVAQKGTSPPPPPTLSNFILNFRKAYAPSALSQQQQRAFSAEAKGRQARAEAWAESLVRKAVGTCTISVGNDCLRIAFSKKWFSLAVALAETGAATVSLPDLLLIAGQVAALVERGKQGQKVEAVFRAVLDRVERSPGCRPASQLDAFVATALAHAPVWQGRISRGDLALQVLQFFSTELVGDAQRSTDLVKKSGYCPLCTSFLVMRCGAQLFPAETIRDYSIQRAAKAFTRSGGKLNAEIAVHLEEFAIAKELLRTQWKQSEAFVRAWVTQGFDGTTLWGVVFDRVRRRLTDWGPEQRSLVEILDFLAERDALPPTSLRDIGAIVSRDRPPAEAVAPIWDVVAARFPLEEPLPWLVLYPTLLYNALGGGMPRADDELIAHAFSLGMVDSVRVLRAAGARLSFGAAPAIVPTIITGAGGAGTAPGHAGRAETLRVLLQWPDFSPAEIRVLANESAPLAAAAQLPDAAESLACCSALLDAGATPAGVRAADDAPLLYCAVRDRRHDIALRFIAAGADPNEPSPAGETPLARACTAGGREDVVVALLRAGARGEAVAGLLCACCRLGMWEAASMLVDARADADYQEPETQRTALHWACDRQAPAALVRGLLALTTAVTAGDRDDRPALFYASTLEASALLLSNVGSLGPSQIAQACTAGALCASRLYAFLCLGPSPQDLAQRLARPVAQSADPASFSLLCCASRDLRAHRYALKAIRIREQSQSPWWFPLHVAASTGNTALVQSIIAQGIVPLGSRDALGNTALHYSSAQGHVAVSSLLLTAIRSRPELDGVAQLRDSRGRTALQLVLDRGNARAVVQMVDCGCATQPELMRVGFAERACCDAVCEELLSRIRSECRAASSKFTDASFPPADQSLWSDEKTASGIGRPSEWKRISDFDGPVLFREGSPAPGEAEQGEIGTCYLLTALALVATLDGGAYLRDKVFYAQKSSDASIGVYALRMHTVPEGRAAFVIVDDHIPFGDVARRGDAQRSLQPVFAHTRLRDQWYAAVLEKAYAKLRGCYQSIDGGDEGEALRCLLGGTLSQIGTTSADLIRERSKGNLWHVLAGLHSDPTNHHLLTTRLSPVGEVSARGLLPGHSYGILRFVTLARKHHLVQLYNPYEDEEWEGDWAHNSPAWTPQLREQVQAQCSHSFRPKSGLFFMDFESDFLRYFTAISVCTAPRDNSAWRSRRVYSEELPRTPATLIGVSLKAEAIVICEAVQALSEQERPNELQVLAGFLAPDAFDLVSGRAEKTSRVRLQVHEHSAQDAILRHMEVLARTRPSTSQRSTLELCVHADRLGPARKVLFVAVLARPTGPNGARRFRLSINAEVPGGGDVATVVAGLLPVDYLPRGPTAPREGEGEEAPGTPKTAPVKPKASQFDYLRLEEQLRTTEEALKVKEEEIRMFTEKSNSEQALLVQLQKALVEAEAQKAKDREELARLRESLRKSEERRGASWISEIPSPKSRWLDNRPSEHQLIAPSHADHSHADHSRAATADGRQHTERAGHETSRGADRLCLTGSSTARGSLSARSSRNLKSASIKSTALSMPPARPKLVGACGGIPKSASMRRKVEGVLAASAQQQQQQRPDMFLLQSGGQTWT
eukprot:m51a1_g7519 putative calpain-type cysteine protease dek1 (1986) ;mRNA; f:8452-15277